MKIVDSAHGGDGWIERRDSHIEELGSLWAQCGVKSETHPLKHVLLHRPGKEIEDLKDTKKILWTNVMNPEKARDQHDNLANIYSSMGIKITYMDNNKNDGKLYPNLLYVRDLFTMFEQGAIISRLASDARAGEERLIAATLTQQGIPIIATAHGEMCLEGPDILIVNKHLVFLGIGIRTNLQGVLFVKTILENQGYEEVKIIQTTYGCGHLDGVVNIINKKYAAIIPQRASYELYATLKKHGFSIVDLTDTNEADELMSINFVSLNEEELVVNKGAKDALSKYRSCGMNVIEVDVSELLKGGGSVHCMTGIISRF
ncbi:arginine deiminase family protein [Paenibacillus polymyxa]|uniref:dimethylarginine dimethylaminohydrolase family protein n=1 Tax=Paenibacillus polymyxa TaxID=1406 RepID=UPI002AB45053|nr:arginine deiminase family protein [Paenibacillus polymyxa]MDY7989864.1 arginine deiminase family protein [Paenibacillus polymyxa]MDY8116777.1 arginine deiminase family protein [Paenibacillus polymyxa]